MSPLINVMMTEITLRTLLSCIIKLSELYGQISIYMGLIRYKARATVKISKKKIN